MLLAREGVRTHGKVEKLTPEFHNTYLYIYSVANVQYSSVGQINSRDLKVGDPVEVIYIARNPDISTDGDLAGKVENEWKTIAIGIFILPALLTFAFEHAVVINRRRKP
jgi:hypothetical protein